MIVGTERPPSRAWAVVAGSAVLLGLARLLPEGGAGLALRLAAASALVLIMPGALIVRVVGRPAQLGVALTTALVWSLAVVGAGLALVFALGASIVVALPVLGAVVLLALVLPRQQASEVGRSDLLAVLGVAIAGVALASVVWWSTGPAGGSVGPTAGDAFFHLARVRKLAQLPSLSLSAVDEFRDGSLHPGYAFPLWHAAVALIARLAGVDAAPAFRFLPAILTPLALIVAYAVGQALFGTWAGGVATAAAQAAIVAFSRGGVGGFQFLSQPGAAARLLLLPALLALFFAFATVAAPRLLVSMAVASLVLTLVHPSYLVYAALLIGGFAAARLLLDRRDRRSSACRVGAALATVLVPAGLALAWLAPLVRQAAAFSPSHAETRRALGRYAADVIVSGSSFSLSPPFIAWGGAATVAALAAVPLVALAGRQAWAAYVIGGTVVLGAIALVPMLFTRFADALTLSQALRVSGFLPLAFALAGAAEIAARAGIAGPVLALGAGVAALLAYPHVATGAGWAVWLAVCGASAALIAGSISGLRRPESHAPDHLTALTAVAFVLPLAVTAYTHLHRDDRPDPFALTPGLVRSLHQNVKRNEVVFSNVETSYRISAAAPVYVAASLPGHVARTRANKPYERQWDVVRFFFRTDVTDAERRALLKRYRAEWIVEDRRQRSTRFLLRFQQVYGDARYRLYRVPAH